MTRREIAFAVCGQFVGMLENNVLNECGGESFKGWCADGEVFEEEADPQACMDFVEKNLDAFDAVSFLFEKELLELE